MTFISSFKNSSSLTEKGDKAPKEVRIPHTRNPDHPWPVRLGRPREMSGLRFVAPVPGERTVKEHTGREQLEGDRAGWSAS